MQNTNKENKANKEFCVIHRTSAQINENDYVTYNEVMKVNEETTIKEIVEWFYKTNPRSRKMYIEISEF